MLFENWIIVSSLKSYLLRRLADEAGVCLWLSLIGGGANRRVHAKQPVENNEPPRSLATRLLGNVRLCVLSGRT